MPSSNFRPFKGEQFTTRQIGFRVNKSLAHVEGHAASTIRTLNLESGMIVINNASGPCPNCITGIPRILPNGATLEVSYTDTLGRSVTDIFTGGQLFNPNNDRKIENIDF